MRRRSEHDFLKGAQLFLIAVVTWFLLNTGGEVVGSQASDTAWGQVLGKITLITGVILLPVALVALGVLWILRRRDPAEEARVRRSEWREPGPLYDRKSEVDRAVRAVAARGLVAVVGPRDIGTSAVAETVVHRLVTEHRIHHSRVSRFDLRSRSSHRPDDARVAAGRLLAEFDLKEPADATAELLADAGRRLVEALAQRNIAVLMLDNVSVPEEIEWLVGQWPVNRRQWLVIAGETAIEAVAEDSRVRVGELSNAGLRAMWDAEMKDWETGGVPQRRSTRLWKWITALTRGDATPAGELDHLLTACLGRPRAIKAFLDEIFRPGGDVSVASLLAAVERSGAAEGPLERVWTALLDDMRSALSPDAVRLLHALAELPVTALTRDAVAAILPGRAEAAEPLEELRIRRLVQEDNGRYRMATEIRRAVTGTTPEPARRSYAAKAVPALLRYYARAAADGVTELSGGRAADTWFRDEELSLRPLFDKESYPHPELITKVIDDLATIADALESWYVRERLSGGLHTVSSALVELAEAAGRPELVGIALVRMATARRMADRLDDADANLRRAADKAEELPPVQAAELRLRVRVERALLCLAGKSDDDLAAEHRELAEILAAHPDHAGAPVILLNLGALCLRQARPDDALEHLRRVAELTTDRGCRAHAAELRGIALCAKGELAAAVEQWQEAMAAFGAIGERPGLARCLQHLGTAALEDPAIARRIDAGTEPTERAAALLAGGLLRRAKDLRAGQPDLDLVDHYLTIADGRATS